MNRPAPLFITGTARSGTTLLCYMLNAHPNVMVAMDPYLPLIRSFRNAVIRQSGDGHLQSVFDPESAISDYYFDSDRLRILEVIQMSKLDIPFYPSEWSGLMKASLSRIQIECGDLVPYLEKIRGATYREMFDAALAIIVQARHAETRRWTGFKEVWTIEFFMPFAHAYPQARFIVIQRDPRSVLASFLAIAERDISQKVHVLSFLRHWRKYAAFIRHYRDHPFLARRIHFIKYEQLVSKPKRCAQQLCEFLEIPFEPAMLESQNYLDYTTGRVWKGNSSFLENLSEINPSQTEKWRDQLDISALKTVEFVCSPEMILDGYKPNAGEYGCEGDADILEYLYRDAHATCSWRSDFGDVQQDYGFELFRRSLLNARGEMDPSLIRRSFLFEEVYTRLRNLQLDLQ